MVHILSVLLLSALTVCCTPSSGGGTTPPEVDTLPAPRVFVHPGVTVTNDDISRMRTLVANQTEPAYSAYLELKDNQLSHDDYQMRGPFEVISREAARYGVATTHEIDMAAAYLNALVWSIDQTEANAEKALDIIWQYSTTLQMVDPETGVILVSGFAGFHVAKTMEILKHTYSVPEEKLASIDTMLTQKFIPLMIADLEKAPYHIGNQDAVGNRGLMAIAVYLDDAELYEWARNFFLDNVHNGCVKNYINAETGQCQESGRDQRHAQLGLGAMAETCEIAHKQGDDDLYSAYDNLILKGFEYTAQYNLGLSVPFEVMSDVTGRSDWAYKSISTEGRGEFLPYYEIVYNHYAVRNHLAFDAEMVLSVLEESRPETVLSNSYLQHTFASLVYYKSK